jgi:sterol desaturase/sphingolipid hydroxylase (fatty acid hydroxylase superfamily)
MLMEHLLSVVRGIYTSPLNLILVSGFVLAEWWVPAQYVNRRVHLPLDVLGFVAGIVFILPIYALLRDVSEWIAAMDWMTMLRGIQSLPSWGKLLLCALCIDFTGYWAHRAMHHFPCLWTTHRWHHSIEQLYWFSGFRASFFQILILGIPQVIFPFLVFQMSLMEGVIAVGIINFLQFWKHANIRVPWGPLECLFVTPHYHAIHHSRDHAMNHNFGFMFTLWDRLFGTQLPSQQLERPFAMGLTLPQKKSVWRMILGL